MNTDVLTKPSARSLAKGSRAFIAGNFEYFKLYVKTLAVPVLAAILVVQVVQLFLPGEGALKANPREAMNYLPFYGAIMLAGLFVAYLQACFALSWHRAVLLGAKAEHVVNPFALKPGEGKFVWAFFVVGLLPVLFGACGGALFGLAMLSHSAALGAIAGILIFVLIVYGLILALRMMFILPARSINAPVGWGEARKISRGLVWKLFAAGFWWTIAVSIMIAIWTALVAAISSVMFNQPGLGPFSASHHSPAEVAFLFIFSSVPATLVKFYLTAFGVTILSRLYMWSVQNRPLDAAPNKDGAA